MRIPKDLAFGVLAWLTLGTTAFADVQLAIQDGRVSLVAKDATLRQILTEWARVGHAKVVNVERIPGGPLTLQLTNVPEQQALEVLLRTVSGYMLAPRAVPASNLSRFDRIIVMPTSVAPRVAATPAPVFQQPQFQPPFPPPPQPGDDEDGPTPNPAVPGAPRGPVFNTFPQPQVVTPQQRMAPAVVPGVTGGVQQQPTATTPTAPGTPTPPVGTRRPGEIIPAPPQPAQPGAPAVPGRPGSPEGQ